MTTRLFTTGALAMVTAVTSPWPARIAVQGAQTAGSGLPASGQAAGRRVAPPQARSPQPGGRKTWAVPRTPWGDPDLQGNFTNKYEQSTPFERPPEFEGRRVEDVTGAELADVLEKRQQQVIDRRARRRTARSFATASR